MEPQPQTSHSAELYSPTGDPGERNNVASMYPERTARMQEALTKHIQCLDLPNRRQSAFEETDPVALRRLQVLGYLDSE